MAEGMRRAASRRGPGGWLEGRLVDGGRGGKLARDDAKQPPPGGSQGMQG